MPRITPAKPDISEVTGDALADVPSSEEPATEPAPAQPNEDAGPVVVAATSDSRFILGSWGGLAQYNCTRCPWDTVTSLDAFNAHWEAHLPPKPPPPVSVLVAPDGRPLTSEV